MEKHHYFPLSTNGRLVATCGCHWMQSLTPDPSYYAQSAPPASWPPPGIDGQRKRRAR